MVTNNEKAKEILSSRYKDKANLLPPFLNLDGEYCIYRYNELFAIVRK
ncbi:hypothetical protein GPZ88_10160 (plasmid) [Streptococcus ruminicola]|uniref:Uncharacterized protein n=1 Tax=Streptococcus ruminicola TaxID=2686210 RepID=A0A6G8I2V9_9STRE|nr:MULTISPECIES: hypothetical protein [Streptococcus]QGX47381.1 hypothetical protein GPA00_09615 [Streptococcus equinus]QIM47429.1 hypothetical protein GPZ88_10160 [Streptococcus ruminicola]